MSRTDKDRPLWVLSNDPTVRRRQCHNHVGADGDPIDVCTLDDGAVPYWDETRRPCTWRFDLYRIVKFPSADYEAMIWWRPQRAATRDRLRLLAKQYRADGEIDDDLEPPPDQHRGSAVWRYW